MASTASMKHHERLIVDAYRTRMGRMCALRFAENPTADGLDTLIASLQGYRDTEKQV